MMSVLEYAEDVGKTLEEIIKLCEKLNINKTNEDDLLDQDEITMLDSEIANVEVASDDNSVEEEPIQEEQEEDREGPAGRELLGLRGAFLLRPRRGHRPRGSRHRHVHLHQPPLPGLRGRHPEHLGGPRQNQGNQQGKQRRQVI